MQIIGMKDYWTYGANSKKEFEAWVKGDHEKRTHGGQPWEILRGGNTTKISMYLNRPE
jgi:hypothetical protein